MVIDNGFLVTTEGSIRFFCGICHSRIWKLRFDTDGDIYAACESCDSAYGDLEQKAYNLEGENKMLQNEIKQLADKLSRIETRLLDYEIEAYDGPE